MKFTLKSYKTSKTEKYLRTNNLFFFFSGVKLSIKIDLPLPPKRPPLAARQLNPHPAPFYPALRPCRNGAAAQCAHSGPGHLAARRPRRRHL